MSIVPIEKSQKPELGLPVIDDQPKQLYDLWTKFAGKEPGPDQACL